MKSKGKNTKRTQSEPIDPIIKYPHGVPLTRRDMLKAGVIQFSAAMALPSLYQLFARAGVAEAQQLVCDNAAAQSMAVFVHLSLAGGAAMAANVVPMDAGGLLLPTYSILGLGNPANLTITREFANNAPFPGNNVAGMITGMRTGAQATTLKKSVFVSVPVRSQDDSSTNKFDITGAVTRAGFKGNSLPNLGTVGSPTGGRHMPAFVDPPAPLIVNSYADLANAINVAGSLGQLTTNEKIGLFRMVTRLTASQAASLSTVSGGDQLGTLTQCATQTNQKLVSTGSTGTSPLENQSFANVWNINQNTSQSSRDFVFAAMVYNALKGNSGTINLNMGGYDYHGNARNNTNAQDTAAGVVIGQILESAAVMGKRLFLAVTSDGAVGSPASDSSAVSFSADRGLGGVAYMMAFDPSSTPKASASQLGQFTTGQAADDTFISGSSPELAAASIFANYLSFNNQLANLDVVMPRAFTPDQVPQVVKISG